VFKLDLKRAETALQAGRLDDAFRILRASAEVRHADGQKLVDQLVAALVERSQEHFDRDHFQQARRDAELAEKLGGRQVEVVKILQQVNSKDQSIAGRAARQANDELGLELEKIVSEGNHEAVIRRYRDIQNRRSLPVSIKAHIETAVQQMTAKATSDLVSGRLDRCESTLRSLFDADLAGTVEQELKLQLQRCYNVNRAVEQSQYGDAIRELRLLAQVIPDAAWVESTIQSLQVCLESVEQIKSGPFGLLQRPAAVSVKQVKAADVLDWNQKSHYVSKPIRKDRFQKNESPAAVGSVLQVDHLGSLLLIQGDVVSFGGATTSGCDVAIQTDGVKDRILICRDGEDYFAVSNTPFFVNELLADRHLLVDGDTVHVGVRGRLKFTKPMPVSSSAVLQITGSKLKRRDVRSVVLFEDAVVFGSRVGHFRLPDVGSPLILRPVADSKGQFLLHQKGSSDRQLLNDGISLEMNDCHFALASIQTMGGVS